MSDPILDRAIRLIDEIVEAEVRQGAVLYTDEAVVKIRKAVPDLLLSSEGLTNLIAERAIAARAALRLETPLEIIPPEKEEGSA